MHIYVPMCMLHLCMNIQMVSGKRRREKFQTKQNLRVCEYRKGGFKEHMQALKGNAREFISSKHRDKMWENLLHNNIYH